MGHERLYAGIEEDSTRDISELAKRDPEAAAEQLVMLAKWNEALAFGRDDARELAGRQRDWAAALRRIVEEQDAA